MIYCDTKGCLTTVDKLGVACHKCKALSEVVKDSVFDQTKAVKHDTEKTRLDLIHPEFIEQLGRALTFGAKKYSPTNYLKGLNYSQLYAAIQRHLNAWRAKEDNDPESGLSHLAHAGADIMMLLVLVSKGDPALDDREV